MPLSPFLLLIVWSAAAPAPGAQRAAEKQTARDIDDTRENRRELEKVLRQQQATATAQRQRARHTALIAANLRENQLEMEKALHSKSMPNEAHRSSASLRGTASKSDDEWAPPRDGDSSVLLSFVLPAVGIVAVVAGMYAVARLCMQNEQKVVLGMKRKQRSLMSAGSEGDALSRLEDEDLVAHETSELLDGDGGRGGHGGPLE